MENEGKKILEGLGKVIDLQGVASDIIRKQIDEETPKVLAELSMFFAQRAESFKGPDEVMVAAHLDGLAQMLVHGTALSGRNKVERDLHLDHMVKYLRRMANNIKASPYTPPPANDG